MARAVGGPNATFDDQKRVSRPCPRCGDATYATGGTGRYWLHSESDLFACADGEHPMTAR